MAQDIGGRRLAAILASDVVGFSKLMGQDESGTLAALKRHRETLFDPTVAAHNGRIVKLMGDGALVEFGSVVEAVSCAIAVQKAAASALPSSPAIVLRIGINLGDVIIEGEDIYGDGVNVAARLEPLAEPGGLCIAAIVHEAIGNRIEADFRDGGDIQVKNITRPVRVWKWHPSHTGPAEARAATAPAKPKSAGPSIAVLPFQNLSGDKEQEYFSDGITEDIITDLSKIGGLLVIARNSSFAYKGRQVDVRTVAAELAVRSVLEGSIRRAANRVRISAQLIDPASGGNLWADRYDRDLNDIFAVQDEVTRQIVDALKLTLSPREAALLGSEPIDARAHDYFLLGREILFGPIKSREVFDRSTDLFAQAIAADPGYGEPYAGLGMAHLLNYQNHWTEDSATALDRAEAYVQQALARSPDVAFVHYVISVLSMHQRNFARWASEADAALAINPNYAPAHNARGIIHIYAGVDPLLAVPHIEQAIRLDPLFRQQYIHFLGTAYLVAGKYETAAALFQERVRLSPKTDLSRAFLASALGHLGDVAGAKRVWQELAEVNPKYSFAEHIGRLPFKNPADVERITEGLRQAGLFGAKSAAAVGSIV